MRWCGGRSSIASGSIISARDWSTRRTISAAWARCRRIPNCSTGWPAGSSTTATRSRSCTGCWSPAPSIANRPPTTPQFARLDAGNRYLWRMNRQRLDAECIRDAVLAVSGKLDLAMGGPSVQQFFFKDDHSPIYDYARFDVDDPRSLRRSVYRFLVRSVPDPFMECLDCADPSILTPKRNTTLTAIQALALLNNPLATRQAEHFAARLQTMARRRAGPDRRGVSAGAGPPADRARSARLWPNTPSEHGLANACRVIFNSNEFVFVD